MIPLVEVRIPTYKRPHWLQRALESLIQQTHSNWVAFVFDDSPEEEGRAVVEALGDARIQYEKNETRLGGAGNLDKSFRKTAFSPESSYATILEDDNWYFPEFLAQNIADIEKAGTKILLRNQETWIQEEDNTFRTERTTRGKWFKEGVYSQEELHTFLLFHEGISNGGLFWDVRATSDLEVGETVDDPGLQEFLRTLQISESIYYSAKPLSVWSKMDGNLIMRLVSENRRYNRGKLAVKDFVFKQYGLSCIERAREIALTTGHARLFEEAIIELGASACRGQRFFEVNALEKFELRNKVRLRRLLISNPLKAYFKQKWKVRQ